MLPGPHRLRSRQDFQAIYQLGQSWHGQYFVAWVLPRGNRLLGAAASVQEPTRIGIVVGKKVSNLAVKRNQVKRRIRQASRELSSHFPPDLDIIIIARRGAVDLQAEQFLPELKQLLAQAGILYGH